MEEMILKILKPVVLSLICFVSAMYLFGNITVAFAISLVPLIFGWLRILMFIGEATTACMFMSAILWLILPSSMKDFVSDQSNKVIEQIKRDVNQNNTGKQP